MHMLLGMPQARCRCTAVLLWASLSSLAASLPLRLAADSRTSLLSQREGSAAPPYDFDNGARPPTGHFKPESTDPDSWPRDKQKTRNRLLSSSKSFGAELEKWSKDETVQGGELKDSFLWANLDAFKLDDTTEYWSDLCNGTNMSERNKMIGDPVKKLNATIVFADWKVDSDQGCSYFVNDEEYTDTISAFKECGSTCDGLQDTGCNQTSIRLCATGGARKAVNNTCIMGKPANFKDPKGMPRPPIELKFWKDFCKYRIKGRELRIMFEGKNCAETAVKALDEGEDKAGNPVECAEFAQKDAECSKVFDFRFGPPAKCRCLKKDSGCAPAVAKGGHVYGPTKA